MKLGTYAFYPNSSKKREDCLIGIFHSMIKEKYKQRIFESLKGSGTKRVVVATSALSMGVNFPDVKYVVMYGPPRNLLDFHQQAGRAGRDGALAHTVLFYYGQQVAHVENEMREFLQSSDCFRVASYSKFDKTITPLSPHHICCNTCSKNCECGSLECKVVQIPHEQQTITGDAMLHVSPLRRSVNEEDRSLLKDALEAHQTQFSIGGNITAFGLLSCYGFSKEAISDVLDNCHKLFTIKDILYCVPVFSTVHAKEVLSVINEVFDDIDESTFQSTDDDGGTTDFKQFSLDDLLQSEFNETALAEDLNEYDFI
ncbi:uncharacterized protein LOC114531368 [Dendronephthya gigantea]|uniref:uncharacterized protein LOC114531368 n=1 Tax=Dendronephthya gigantea TaxID=151771 RepID=UPI00106BFAEA|nr:uncharacterized protein LOC114531368 [Dendronephthya gigantea]